MNRKTSVISVCRAALLCAAVSCASAHATIVQFQTSLGSFEVNLYDEATPETVANFLAYLEAGAYDDTFIHRSVAGFIVQGGGFTLGEDNKVQRINALLSPPNEPAYSNVRGTIAMAKLGGDPDSATSQWFLNLGDNSANLDQQNGGFTVFGEVVADGMDVVDAIGALPIFNLDAGTFSATPLRGYNQQSAADFNANPGDYLMMIDGIVVIDAAVDTAAGLTPKPNTKIQAPPEEPVSDEPTPEEPVLEEPAPEPAPLVRKKKGGAMDWLAWISLAGVASIAAVRRDSRRVG